MITNPALDLGSADRWGQPSASSSVDELLAQIPRGEIFAARDLLAARPELSSQESIVLDLAYEEFCRRRDCGESIDPQKFAAQFSTVADSLLRLIAVDELLGPFSLDTATTSWPVAGDEWLQFQLLEELGRGAYSRVYLARDQTLGNRLVVVKATPLGTHEAETLGRLGHGHIVPVHSVCRDERLGLTAVCMSFLSRASLFDLIRALFSSSALPRTAGTTLSTVQRLNTERGGLVPEDQGFAALSPRTAYVDFVLNIGIQLAKALSHAHRLGVLHGDIKPSNVLLTDRGRAVLLDFNLSLATHGAHKFVGGTIPYMAPEQLSAVLSQHTESPCAADSRTDIFSLGVTLFELLHGRSAFGEVPAHATPLAAAAQLLEQQRRGPIVLDSPGSVTDESVAAAIVECLHFDPARRPQSMEELHSRLLNLSRLPSRGQRWLKRHLRPVAALALGICATGVAIGIWLGTRPPYAIREMRSGQAAYTRGDYAEAEQHLSSALKVAPQLTWARLFRAGARFRQDDAVGAHADFYAVSQDWHDGRATAGVAHTIAVLGNDNDRATFLYRQAVDQGYRSAVAYNNLGFCLSRSGKLADAIVALRRATQIDPLLAAAHHNLARADVWLAIQQRRVPDPAAIETALRLAPETTTLDLDAALTYAVTARYAVDEEDRTRALDRCFVMLERAVLHRATRAQLAAIASANLMLGSDARWPALQSHLSSAGPPDSAVLLLDPLPELLAPNSSDTPPAETH